MLPLLQEPGLNNFKLVWQVCLRMYVFLSVRLSVCLIVYFIDLLIQIAAIEKKERDKRKSKKRRKSKQRTSSISKNDKSAEKSVAEQPSPSGTDSKEISSCNELINWLELFNANYYNEYTLSWALCFDKFCGILVVGDCYSFYVYTLCTKLNRVKRIRSCWSEPLQLGQPPRPQLQCSKFMFDDFLRVFLPGYSFLVGDGTLNAFLFSVPWLYIGIFDVIHVKGWKGPEIILENFTFLILQLS